MVHCVTSTEFFREIYRIVGGNSIRITNSTRINTILKDTVNSMVILRSHLTQDQSDRRQSHFNRAMQQNAN